MTVDEIAKQICDERYQARIEVIEECLQPMVRSIVERALQLFTDGHTSQCSRCGEKGNLGEFRIASQFSLDEMEELVFATSIYPVKRRLLCAIRLLDDERADRIEEELKQL